MSGDFRLKDAAAYEAHYGHVHPCPELLADFVYGLPELNRERIRGARLVASPGCFATTIELMLLPLARAGLLTGVVHVQGITGSSGSGVAPSAGTHHPVRAGNLKTYKPLEHQHVPEIAETLAPGRGARPRSSASCRSRRPLGRGILATGFVELPEAWTQAKLDALYREAYAGEPFVRVPRAAAARGGGGLRLQLRRGGRGGRRARRAARRTVTVFGSARQPGEGRRRPGHREHEPHARARRAGVARRPGTVATVTDLLPSAKSGLRRPSSSSWAGRSPSRPSSTSSPTTCGRCSTAGTASPSSTAAGRRPPRCRRRSASSRG